MLPIWLILVTLVLVLGAGSAFYQMLVRRARRTREKARILERVAELEERRAS